MEECFFEKIPVRYRDMLYNGGYTFKQGSQGAESDAATGAA